MQITKRQIPAMIRAVFGKNFVAEYQFDKVRKWRFDFAIIAIKVAIEYEGVFTKEGGKTRHLTAIGYGGDCTKYNAAAIQGWVVLRYTAATLGDLQADLIQIKKMC